MNKNYKILGGQNSLLASLLLLLLALLPCKGWADETITNGNYIYKLNNDGENTVTLTEYSDGSGRGYFKIVSPFTEDGKTYTVTQIGDGGKKIRVESNYWTPAAADAIPETVTKIDAHAFADIMFREGVDIPASVKSIGDYAFTDPKPSYVILKGDTPITAGENIFGTGVDEEFYISVPESLIGDYKNDKNWSTYANYFGTEVDKDGFRYLKNAEGTALTLLGFDYGRDEKTSVTVPAQVDNIPVTTIVKKAFYDETDLNSLDLTQATNLTKICESAFRYTSLEQVTIPQNIKIIGENAFGYLKKNLNIKFERLSEISEYSNKMFNKTNVATIEVPDEAFLAYYSQLTNSDNIQDKIQKPEVLTIKDDGANGVTKGMENKTYEPGKITYKRTFSQAGQYATIALPFDVASSEWKEYFEAVYTLSGAESMGAGLSRLKFQEVSNDESLQAKSAYFIKLKNDVQQVTLTNATQTEIEADQSQEGNVVSYDNVKITSYASWQKIESDDVAYYTFNADGTFGKSEYVVPFRMYLTIENDNGGSYFSAPAFFSIELPNSSTTDIHGVAAEVAGSKDAIYSIDGKLVRTDGNTKGLAKGIYVKNGKKMVIK